MPGEDVRADDRLADPLGQARRALAGQFQAAFAAADRRYTRDLGGGRFVDHRPHVGAGIGRVADHQRPRRFDQPAEEQVVDAGQAITRLQAEHFCPL